MMVCMDQNCNHWVRSRDRVLVGNLAKKARDTSMYTNTLFFDNI